MTDPAAAKVAPLQYRLSRLRRRLFAERAVFSIIILFLLYLTVHQKRVADARLITVQGLPIAVLGSLAEAQDAIDLVKRNGASGWKPEEVKFAPPLVLERIPREGKPLLNPRTAARAISRAVQLVVPGCGIQVNGRGVVVLANAEQAEQALERLRNHYLYAGAGAKFLEKVKLVTTDLPIARLATVDDALACLLKCTPRPRCHTVAAGETAIQVASAAGLGVHQLARLNPNLDLARLAPSTRVVVGTQPGSPPITVETYREEYVYAAIPAPLEQMSTTSLPPRQSKVVQAGRPGKGKYLLRTAYRNGQQVRQTKILQEVLEPPTPRRLLVGS